MKIAICAVKRGCFWKKREFGLHLLKLRCILGESMGFLKMKELNRFCSISGGEKIKSIRDL